VVWKSNINSVETKIIMLSTTANRLSEKKNCIIRRQDYKILMAGENNVVATNSNALIPKSATFKWRKLFETDWQFGWWELARKQWEIHTYTWPNIYYNTRIKIFMQS
jgi:hypothetical protein